MASALLPPHASMDSSVTPPVGYRAMVYDVKLTSSLASEHLQAVQRFKRAHLLLRFRVLDLVSYCIGLVQPTFADVIIHRAARTTSSSTTVSARLPLAPTDSTSPEVPASTVQDRTWRPATRKLRSLGQCNFSLLFCGVLIPLLVPTANLASLSLADHALRPPTAPLTSTVRQQVRSSAFSPFFSRIY